MLIRTLLLFFSTIIIAEPIDVGPFGATLESFLDPEDSDFVIFKVSMGTGTWLGLGFGTSNMALNSDLIMINGAVANLTVYDMYSVGKKMPQKDDWQDL